MTDKNEQVNGEPPSGRATGGAASGREKRRLMVTQLLRSPILNPAGDELGRLADLIVKLDGGGYPPVTGIKVRMGGRDVYVVPLPAVLTVKEGLNLPRYPSVPGRMRARSKPVMATTPVRPAPHLELVRLAVPAGQGRRAESLGSGPAAAPAVVHMLQEAGLL